MKKEVLIKKLNNNKYGYPYFKYLIDKDIFFNTEERLDIKYSNTSTLQFNKDIPEIFNITDKKFKECYNAVIHGEGNEKNKINSLRSSSLLSLLTFYKIHSGYKLEISTKINNETINFIFNEVVFEKTNRVFHPSVGLSSIDVALYGTANGDNCVLYLESKFTEYLEQANMCHTVKDGKEKYPISAKYKSAYGKFMKDHSLITANINIENKGKGIELIAKDNDKLHYCEGIKQMISHYIGATNSEDLYKGLKVYLGTILYDFSKIKTGVDDNCNLISDYKKCYSELAKRLNKDKDKNKNLIVLEDPFTYQDFFSNAKNFELDEIVKEYYSL